MSAAAGGWETWSWDESLFAGAAGYYEQGRLPYAPGLADAFARSLGLDGTGRLLDVGCGPGTVTLVLAWRRAHEEFDPFRLPLVQRKSHILQNALGGLTEAETRVLRTIAAFRAPATYDTLAAVLAGDSKPCPDEATLDLVLADLEDRGLVGWDRLGNRYDLHPVVRGVAWSALDSRAQHDIYQNLASHFEALPEIDASKVKTLDDLTGAIELYHTLLQLRRVEDAFKVLDERITNFVFDRIWAFREMAELMGIVLQMPEIMQILQESDNEDFASRPQMAAIIYYICGDYSSAQEIFSRAQRTLANRCDELAVLGCWSQVLCHLGALADADRMAREAVGIWKNLKVIEQADTKGLTLAITALGMIRARCGIYEEGLRWFFDYRVMTQPGSLGSTVRLTEAGIAALRQGDISAAQEFARQMTPATDGDQPPQVQVQAKALNAAIAEALGEHERSRDLLSDALVLARQGQMTDAESRLLVQLGDWNARHHQLDVARRHAADALQIAEHGQLRLRKADVFNLLSSIEHASGNRGAAADAAAEAARLAWCDGPPFMYEWGIRAARENLARAGKPDAAGLPSLESSPATPDPGIVPTSPSEALALQPPLDDITVLSIISRLPDDNESAAALRSLSEQPATSPEVRAAAMKKLA